MTSETLKLDQALFGYEDGHRLLASSIPLGEQATSHLTELSDLAPGVVFGRSSGYWTGIPLPSLRRYALMRTWPAPEMPRPGCVWSHVLLLEPSLLEMMADLEPLASAARRPASPTDLDVYREELTFAVTSSVRTREPAADHHLVRDLVAGLYGDVVLPIRVSEPGRADAALFAVWSQQWPRLRRNLRFQTAATRKDRPAAAARLDVTLMLSDDPPKPEAVGDGWLATAVRDVEAGVGSDLRAFLWRYGADVRRQRNSFRPLVEIQMLHDDQAVDVGSRILDLVTRAFPERTDAVHLKQDLMDGVIAPRAQLDLLWFVLSQGGEAVFPAPSASGVAKLTELWSDRSSDLLHLAESTAGSEDPLRHAIFETVSQAIRPDQFWTATDHHPRVRKEMVIARPQLLDSDAVLALDNRELIELLNTAPAGSDVTERLLSRILARDDTQLARAALELFPRSVALQVVSAMDGSVVPVGSAWLQELVRRPDILLEPSVFSRVTKTSHLYDLAKALGGLTPDVVAAGSEPWLASLNHGVHDLPDEARDGLAAYLVALAFAAGDHEAWRLLERCFEIVHRQASKSRLPWRARDLLAPVLPELGWRKDWDLALRLRLAAARAYVSHDFPPPSFARLLKGAKDRELLAQAASRLPGGDRLVRATKRH